jgi:hypothetical protein
MIISKPTDSCPLRDDINNEYSFKCRTNTQHTHQSGKSNDPYDSYPLPFRGNQSLPIKNQLTNNAEVLSDAFPLPLLSSKAVKQRQYNLLSCLYNIFRDLFTCPSSYEQQLKAFHSTLPTSSDDSESDSSDSGIDE